MTYSYLSSCSSGSPAAWRPVPRGNEKYYNSLSCLHSLFLDELFPLQHWSRAFFLLLVCCLPRPGASLTPTWLEGGWVGSDPRKFPFIGSVLRPESLSWQIHYFGLRLHILMKSKYPPRNLFYLPKYITRHWYTSYEWVYHILSREHNLRVNKCKKLSENNSWKETDELGQFPLVCYIIIIMIIITIMVTFIDYMWSCLILPTTLFINPILQSEKTELQGLMQFDQGHTAGKWITQVGALDLCAILLLGENSNCGVSVSYISLKPDRSQCT